MVYKNACKKVCTVLLLILAFYLGGLTASAYEAWYQNLPMSCGVFTAVFASIMGIGAKIYHVLFL